MSINRNKQMKLLKVLKPGRVSPFREYQFKSNKLYTCHDFNNNESVPCAAGFYATDFDGLIHSYRKGLCVWECEVSGKAVEINQFKRRYEHFKLLRKLTISEIKQGLIDNSLKAGYNLLEVSFPINPLTGKPKKMKDEYLKLLKDWDSIRHSVRDSVRHSIRESVRVSIGGSLWDSIGYSIWDSLGDSIRDSIRHSIWDSLRDSLWAYSSSFFDNIKKWNYMNHKKGINPFQSGIDLWKSGILQSFSGSIWRLHSGKNAAIIWEGSI